MRISDWSSDVCSSDLRGARDAVQPKEGGTVQPVPDDVDAAGQQQPPASRSQEYAADQLGHGRVVRVDAVSGDPVSLDAEAGEDRREGKNGQGIGEGQEEGRNEAADQPGVGGRLCELRSEEHTSELQSLLRIAYAVFCLKKDTITPAP